MLMLSKSRESHESQTHPLLSSRRIRVKEVHDIDFYQERFQLSIGQLALSRGSL